MPKRSSLDRIEQARRKVKVLLEVADTLIESLEKEDWDTVVRELKRREQVFGHLRKLEGSLASVHAEHHNDLDGVLPLLIAEMGELAGKEKVVQTKLHSALGLIQSKLSDVRKSIRLDSAYSSFKPWNPRFFDHKVK